MCFEGYYIYNRAKLLDPFHGGQLYIYVKCGKCTQCLKNKENEYVARALAEFKKAKDNNGYSYWDTLTYNNNNVPKYLGLLCFSPRHVQLFRKSLLANITRFTRPYYKKRKKEKSILIENKYKSLRKEQLKVLRSQFKNIKNNLAYEEKKKSLDLYFKELIKEEKRKAWKILKDYYMPFHDHSMVSKNLVTYIVSEFGKDTHRPHYHVMLFCSIPNLSPYMLRHFMEKSWPHGFLDRTKTLKKRLITDTGGAIQYVSKYLVKDDYFSKILSNKIHRAYSFYGHRIASKLWSKDKIRRISNFHRQSRGFGLSLITQQKKEHLYHGFVQIPDKKHKFKNVKLPQYIERKLFYTTEKTNEGKIRWILNGLGIHRKIDLANEKITSASLDLESFFHALPQYKSDLVPNPSYFKSVIDRFMNGRSFRSLAEYMLIYKGKMIHDSINVLPDVEEFLLDSLLVKDGRPLFENHIVENSFLTQTRKKVHNNNFVYNSKTGQAVYEFYDKPIKYIQHGQTKITLDSLEGLYCINENRFPNFKDFDKILQIKALIEHGWNQQRENLTDKKISVNLSNKHYNSLNIYNQKYDYSTEEAKAKAFRFA